MFPRMNDNGDLKAMQVFIIFQVWVNSEKEMQDNVLSLTQCQQRMLPA